MLWLVKEQKSDQKRLSEAEVLGLAQTHDSSLQAVPDPPSDDVGLRQTQLGETGGTVPKRMHIHELDVSRVGETRAPVLEDVSVARTLTPELLARQSQKPGDEVSFARTMTPEQVRASSDGGERSVARTLTPEQYRKGLVETIGRAGVFELPGEGTDGGRELGTRDTMASDPGEYPVDPKSHTMPSDPQMRRIGQAGAHDIAYQQQKAAIRARLLGGQVRATTIGRFQILGQLGEGGMGVVYAAYDDKLDRKVAIKVLRGQASKTARTRLLREAQALAKLSHPNIVGVHEVGEHEGQVYLAMEFVRGQSLNEWIEEPRPWRDVIEVFKQAALGLDVAHRHNLIHRDFKPHNAILSEDGTTKVLDFGLARAGDTDDVAGEEELPGDKNVLHDRLTHTGAIMGTPAYMSPEQHTGLQATARSDQFSFCIALYEALYRQHPYNTNSLSELVLGIVEGNILDPPRGSDVPQWVRKVVWRGLCVAPEDRFASMAELVAALEADPARRRRKWMLAAGSLLGMGLGSVALAQFQAPVQEPAAICIGFDGAVKDVWHTDRRQAITDAFSKLEAAYAVEAGPRLVAQFDAYTNAWVAARTGQCEAHERGEISDTLYDRSSTCFAERLAQMDTLAQVIEKGNAEVLEQATVAVASLPAIEVCTNQELLGAEVALPEDLDTAAKIQEGRMELARADGEIQLWQFEEARTRATAVLKLARELDYRPLEAEALIREGSVWMWQGDGEKAYASLSSAAAVAVAHGSMSDAAEAVAKKLFVHAELNGKAEESWDERWLVTALSERTISPEIAWLVNNNLGVIAERVGYPEEAVQFYERALNHVETQVSMRQELLISLQNLGLVHTRLYNYKKVDEYLELGYRSAVELYGQSHPLLSDYLNSLVDSDFHNGRLKQASTRLTAVRQLAEDNHITIPDLLSKLELFTALVAIEQRLPAAEHIHAFNEVSQTASPWFGLLGIELVDVSLEREPLQSQLDSYIERSREFGPEVERDVNAEAAMLCRKAEQWELALQYSTLAYNAAISDTQTPVPERAFLSMIHGSIVAHNGDPELAKTLLFKGLGELPEHDVDARPMGHRALGDIFVQEKKFSQAVTHYRAALHALAGYDDDHPRLTAIRFSLARAITLESHANLSEARGFAEKALWAYRKLGDGFLEERAEVETWLEDHPIGVLPPRGESSMLIQMK